VLVGDHLLLREFGPYWIIFMNVFCYNRCNGNAVRDFDPNGIFIIICFTTLDFPVILNGQFTSVVINIACLFKIK
jgi:hypothetical protein